MVSENLILLERPLHRLGKKHLCTCTSTCTELSAEDTYGLTITFVALTVSR